MQLSSQLETKIPPPVYGLITAFLIWGLAKWLPDLSLLPESLSKPGIALIIIGFSLDITALAQFFTHKTTPNPLSPDKAKSIVISGLYRFSRNPMYLGMLVALTGWALFQGNLAGFACLPGFVIVINQMQILPEERTLRLKFGESYAHYLRQVRRWI